MRTGLDQALVCGLVAFIATCGAPADQDAGDGGPRDAGNDAGRHDSDVQTDAVSIDAWEAGTDIGHDAGPNDPEWVRLPGLPDVCDLEVSMHPERIETLPWQPECGLGCLLPYGAVLTGQVDSDGTRYFVTSSILPGRESYEMFDDSGTCVAAWIAQDRRAGSSCALHLPVVGGGRVAVAAYAFVSGHDELGVDVVWAANIGDPAGLVTPVLTRPNGGIRTIERLFVSASHFAYQSSPDGALYLSDGTATGHLVPTMPTDGPAQHIDLHEDHLLFEAWQSDRIRLAVAAPTGSFAVLHDPDPGDVWAFATDGVDLGWMQLYGWDRSTDTYTSIDLWTASYAIDPAAIAPRRVASLEAGLSVGVLGGGMYVVASGIATSDGGFDAYSLADGTRRHWTPPARVHLVAPDLYYATAEDVAIQSTDGFRRIDPRTLPVVP